MTALKVIRSGFTPSPRILSSNGSARPHCFPFWHAEMAELKLMTSGSRPASFILLSSDSDCSHSCVRPNALIPMLYSFTSLKSISSRILSTSSRLFARRRAAKFFPRKVPLPPPSEPPASSNIPSSLYVVPLPPLVAVCCIEISDLSRGETPVAKGTRGPVGLNAAARSSAPGGIANKFNSKEPTSANESKPHLSFKPSA
mmetsp:Transcript_3109/g.4975  ORF Transcript_3109/g.4975 Transcript_3109/m.4975 type:complete len:200 (-) Transcript_3109:295-894(-)